MKATPLAIISVYLWIALGSDFAPYLITLLMIFPVSIEGFITSIDQLSSKYENQIKLENCPLIKKYIKLYLPMIFPYIIMTLLQTFGMGVKVMIMAEFICQSKNSLGKLIYVYKNNLEFNNLLASLIIIVLLVSIIEIATKMLSYKHTNKLI